MKISIIGAGNVGAACGFAILYAVHPDELVLLDLNESMAKGQGLDLAHSAVAISPKTNVVGGKDYSLIKNSDFVVITAGKATGNPNVTRESLLETNKIIVESICSEIIKYASDATILMVTNPSTQLGAIVRSILKQDVVVMDNQLDTARLKYYLGKEMKILPTKTKSIVFGEHGENMQFEIRDAVTDGVAEKVKKLVRESKSAIVAQKGYTNWGIASQVAKEIQKQIRGDAE